MDLRLEDALPLLRRDIARTLGVANAAVADDVARDIALLDLTDTTAKLVNDVQQHFHDQRIDPLWPACPHHHRHPLWYRAGAWWCAQDNVQVARLGELAPDPWPFGCIAHAG